MPGGAHENMKAWDPEEDELILELYLAEGPKWKSIVKRMPHRTVASVRNRFQRIEKGRKLRQEDPGALVNRCKLCNEPKRGHICKMKRNGGPQVDSNPFGSMRPHPNATANVARMLESLPRAAPLWPEDDGAAHPPLTLARASVTSTATEPLVAPAVHSDPVVQSAPTQPPLLALSYSGLHLIDQNFESPMTSCAPAAAEQPAVKLEPMIVVPEVPRDRHVPFPVRLDSDKTLDFLAQQLSAVAPPPAAAPPLVARNSSTSFDLVGADPLAFLVRQASMEVPLVAAAGGA